MRIALCLCIILIGALSASTSLADEPPSATLQEVVVTATKRSENLQDIPMAVSTLGAADIEQRGIVDFGDYLPSVPGVALEDRGPGRNKTVIRGISSSTDPAEIPTVSTYFGDTLLSILPTTQQSSIDLKLVDIDRVEVLKGPQGTLYGAGSMGGTVRVIPNQPDLNSYSIEANAGTNYMGRSDRWGDNFEAILNAPVVQDIFALRFVGYHMMDPGYIDNVVSAIPQFQIPNYSRRNVNDETTDGGRITALYKATEQLSVTASIASQATRMDGLPDDYPNGVGLYTQDRYANELLQDKDTIGSLNVKYDAHDLELVSATSYIHRITDQIRDLEGFYGIPANLDDETTGHFFSQEIRASSLGSSPLQWIGGIYFSQEDGLLDQNSYWSGTTISGERNFQNILLGGPVIGPTQAPLLWLDHLATKKTRQIAGFGESSYKLTDKWTATVGARYTTYKSSLLDYNLDSIIGGPTRETYRDVSENAFTPKFNVKYEVSEDLNIYGQVAKGFRLGTPNVPTAALCDADLVKLGFSEEPVAKKSDSLWSYEVGEKARLFGDRMTVDSAIFYINWQNVQTDIVLPTCGFQVGANAGRATSRGVEEDLVFALSRAWRLNVSGSYVDAVLAENTLAGSGINGLKGDRLPGVPRVNLEAGLEYQFSFAGTPGGFARVDAIHVGNYYNDFITLHEGIASGDYTLVNFRVGVARGKWSTEMYVKNAANVHVVLLIDPEFPDGRETIGPPRSIGINVRYRD
jgi:outer membrane receptor protein involved in Fe transport